MVLSCLLVINIERIYQWTGGEQGYVAAKNNTRLLKSELEKIYRWLCYSKLSLNVGKTKFACFHTTQRIVAYPELKINNIIIDRVTEYNFLGLIISSNMKWKKHIDHIALKVSKIIDIMYLCFSLSSKWEHRCKMITLYLKIRLKTYSH